MNAGDSRTGELRDERRLLGLSLTWALRFYVRALSALGTALVFIVVFGLAFGLPRVVGAQDVLIRDAQVVDVAAGRVRSGQLVLVRDGRIAQIVSTSSESQPGAVDARVVDAAGGFLIPGFIDTHAHVAMGPVKLERGEKGPVLVMDADPAVGPLSLRSLLAFGITTARDPGGPAEILVGLRERIESGEIHGPRLLVAGDVIDITEFPGLVARVETAEDVRREVRRQAEIGVDMIKLYASLEPELLGAGIEEAHAQGLQAIAHLQATTWTEGARLGLDSILHVLPGSPELLAPEDAELIEREMKLGTQFFYRWFERVDFNSPAIREVVASLVEHGTFVDPTSVLYESVFFGGDERREGVEHIELAPLSLLENWRQLFHFNIGWTEQHFAQAQGAWPRVLEWLRILHDAGVKLTAGTDANNPWIVAGPSWHRELEIFVEAGIETTDVLRIATLNGAAALGLGDEIGTIDVGKTADLVLVRENPLEDVRATRSIEWVMRGGHLYDPEQLTRSEKAPVTSVGRMSATGAPTRQNRLSCASAPPQSAQPGARALASDTERERLFRECLRDYAAGLRRLAAAYEREADLAEDLFQDICLALWQALPRFAGRSSLRSYVYRVAHNRAGTHVSKRRRITGSSQALDPESEGRIPDERPGSVRAERAIRGGRETAICCARSAAGSAAGSRSQAGRFG